MDFALTHRVRKSLLSVHFNRKSSVKERESNGLFAQVRHHHHHHRQRRLTLDADRLTSVDDTHAYFQYER